MNNINQQEKKNKSTREAANKVQLSLVMKLNLRMLAYTLGVLLFINIFLFITIFSVTLWHAEENTAFLIKNLSPDNGTPSSDWRDVTLGYSIAPASNNDDGFHLWKVLHKYTPLKNYDMQRSIGFDQGNLVDLRNLSSLQYRMIFSNEKTIVTYAFGSELTRYTPFLYLLLIFEALLLLSGIRKGARSIRRILRPISDMTQRAQDLTSVASGAVPAIQISHLRELAGTISNIDATKLDKRLPEDSTQKEFKDLASAINSMLNRIDEAYRSQVRFVSDASHELRTPIAVVQGYANLLDRWGKNDQVTMQEAIDAIKSEADNMKDLIEQLLFLARGDNETLQLYLESFDCSVLVEEILRETQMIDSLHTLRMKDRVPAFITADRQLMKQALRILVDNSIKYTPQDGEILVSVNLENRMVRIAVQDNGIGIDPENLPYIFDRFYRSDESRARKTGGSGLGLAIMKWIIDRHNGSIEVISRKDIGTRTTIILSQDTKNFSFDNDAINVI